MPPSEHNLNPDRVFVGNNLSVRFRSLVFPSPDVTTSLTLQISRKPFADSTAAATARSPRCTSRNTSGSSCPSLNHSDQRRSRRHRRLKIQCKRIPELLQRLVLRVALTGDIYLQALRNIDITFPPNRRSKSTFHNSIGYRFAFTSGCTSATNPSRFGIFTFANVFSSNSCPAGTIPFRCSTNAVIEYTSSAVNVPG